MPSAITKWPCRDSRMPLVPFWKPQNPMCSCWLNGLFASERILASAARELGIEVVTHEIGVRPGTIVFGRDSPAPEMNMDRLWESAREIPLNEARAGRLTP